MSPTVDITMYRTAKSRMVVVSNDGRRNRISLGCGLGAERTRPDRLTQI